MGVVERVENCKEDRGVYTEGSIVKGVHLLRGDMGGEGRVKGGELGIK